MVKEREKEKETERKKGRVVSLSLFTFFLFFSFFHSAVSADDHFSSKSEVKAPLEFSEG